jgi:hypothetical protein
MLDAAVVVDEVAAPEPLAVAVALSTVATLDVVSEAVGLPDVDVARLVVVDDRIVLVLVAGAVSLPVVVGAAALELVAVAEGELVLMVLARAETVAVVAWKSMNVSTARGGPAQSTGCAVAALYSSSVAGVRLTSLRVAVLGGGGWLLGTRATIAAIAPATAPAVMMAPVTVVIQARIRAPVPRTPLRDFADEPARAERRRPGRLAARCAPLMAGRTPCGTLAATHSSSP